MVAGRFRNVPATGLHRAGNHGKRTKACPDAADALFSDKAPAATPRPFTFIPKTGIITCRSVITSPQAETVPPIKRNFCAAAASSDFLDRFLLISFHKDTFLNIIGIPECRTLTV